ncbi:RSVR protein, partial [Dromas ardeola]|nr:RSVR protein [Dromas ardeola]
PGRFQCQPGAFCFPAEWRCDGHPDCEDEEDERGCGTATADGSWVTPPRSSGVPPAGGLGRGERGWSSACALFFSLVLLSLLVAVGSIAVWGLSKAKGRSDIFSLERASREQLMPDKSQ